MGLKRTYNPRAPRLHRLKRCCHFRHATLMAQTRKNCLHKMAACLSGAQRYQAIIKTLTDLTKAKHDHFPRLPKM